MTVDPRQTLSSITVLTKKKGGERVDHLYVNSSEQATLKIVERGK